MSEWDVAEWPVHIHPPREDRSILRRKRLEQGEKILVLRLLLSHWRAAVQRDALELAFLFALNDELRRRVVENRPLSEVSGEEPSKTVWLSKLDRQLEALRRNNVISIESRGDSQYITLQDDSGLDSPFADSFGPVIEQSIKAFQLIKSKREEDDFSRDSLESTLRNYLEESDLAQLDTF